MGSITVAADPENLTDKTDGLVLLLLLLFRIEKCLLYQLTIKLIGLVSAYDSMNNAGTTFLNSYHIYESESDDAFSLFTLLIFQPKYSTDLRKAALYFELLHSYLFFQSS